MRSFPPAQASGDEATLCDKGPPAETQCFAWSWWIEGRPCVTFTETKRFAGTRNEIREAAAHYALSRIEHYFALAHPRLAGCE